MVAAREIKTRKINVFFSDSTRDERMKKKTVNLCVCVHNNSVGQCVCVLLSTSLKRKKTYNNGDDGVLAAKRKTIIIENRSANKAQMI